MRAAILEDDPSAAQRVVQYFERYAQEKKQTIQTSYFQTPGSFLAEYKSQYDLILLDIQMPGMNGMRVAEMIRNTDEKVLMVFITRLSQYAIEGYKVRALDYILKPVSYFDFSYMLDRAFQQLQSQERLSIVVNNKWGSSRILVSSIRYIEVQNHKLFIHTAEETIEAWGALTTLENELPPGMFSRVNAGVSVNLNAVVSVTGESVVLTGETIPLSRRKKKDFCENLARYFGGKGYV